MSKWPVNRVLDLAAAIQQIPAPTFDEGRRAAFVRDQFLSEGLQRVEIDELGNVYGYVPCGRERGRWSSLHIPILYSQPARC